MIKYVITALFSASMLTAQTNGTESTQNQVEIGDIFQIGRPTASQYKHVHFPRPNIIIKRGGFANYKRVEGNIVVVTSIKDKKDGTMQIKLKRADGGRFFGSHYTVAADFKDAIGSGELQTN